ncbi:hypothetical protein HMPREF0578_2223 [Mobiluncus mulieris 28-1]|nr:hypothetical protein HMPREF0578_2223 [Mobiluncus mulieris 28-1]EFN92953.1 hypothetical protein HMPREF9278_1597 [Mobiluncus mulieris FB024-16]
MAFAASRIVSFHTGEVAGSSPVSPTNAMPAFIYVFVA